MGKRHGRTNGWGTIAARAFSAAPGAVLVVALAGCSSELQDHGTPAELPAGSAAADTQTSAQAPADDADRPAFHFASGDLVLGDFNYEDIAGNIFNPCEEISAEEFAAIGFEKDEARKHLRRTQQVYSCPLIGQNTLTGQSYMVLSGPGSFDSLEGQAELFDEHVSEVVPGLFTHGPAAIESDVCYASVDTLRGQLSAAVGASESAESREKLCSEAIKLIEKLFMH